jgi:hypothetical protein
MENAVRLDVVPVRTLLDEPALIHVSGAQPGQEVA